LSHQSASVTFDGLLATAHHLADISGPAVLKHFRRPLRVENKLGGGGFDPVTAADRGAEKAIGKALRQLRPGDALIGEEYGSHHGTSGYAWVIDPIDGTRAFIMGSPLWGTLIGLLHDGKPLLGVVDQPFTGERFWSGPKASYMRRAPGSRAKILRTRSCPRLEDAVLTSTHPDLFEGPRRRRTLERLKAKVRLTRYGGDCYHYCLLSAGFIDVIVEGGLQSYDVAALIPIIERAGGVITTWDGRPAADGGDIIACGDPALHASIVDMMASGR
jgi:histidinol phosphatase-like enzyme (inositol monophosphatase family)